jgi:nicotinate dehydrogenase subunit A
MQRRSLANIALNAPVRIDAKPDQSRQYRQRHHQADGYTPIGSDDFTPQASLAVMTVSAADPAAVTVASERTRRQRGYIMAQQIGLTVNGRSVDVAVDDPDTPLLYVLQDSLELRGPRFGCGLSQCGACTVHVDGEAVRSCVTPVSSVTGRQIVTLEGLGTPESPHPLQKAFIDEQAVQCGYCINGMIMQAAAFLAKHRSPTDDEIKQELANNLCRCGTHVRIVRAVKRAAAL